MGLSFETCLRRREDVPLRRLGDVPLRRRWVFHLRRTCDVTGTYRETSLRRRYDVLLPDELLGRWASNEAAFHQDINKIYLALVYLKTTRTQFVQFVQCF